MQRVIIARSLAQETPYVMLDEPTQNLDPPARKEIITLLKDLAKDKSVIVVTHEREVIELQDASIWGLKEGKVCWTPEMDFEWEEFYKVVYS